ncbi:MAG TPA: sigma-70 family RNA polymerase sigma factor [Solirubrobacteraceae bacterium]|nr:sigma-70 family RNA polymerase sigma factor [Solirubrobacteraceae bacterium]
MSDHVQMQASRAWEHGSSWRVPRMYAQTLGDERLARMVADGSDTAFTVLFERFQQPLYRYCRSLVGNDADAQDALQTTFTQAFVALREGARNAPVRPWLYRIAHNEAVSLLRRRRPPLELLVEESGDIGPTPHEIMEQRSRLATLVSDLQALPERQRGVLVMRELGGLSHEEIAVAFGMSVGAARQTVLEARRALQHCAGGRAMGCAEVQQIVSDGDGRALRGRRVRAHLRDCHVCDSFAAAIKTRRADLRALSPALPAVAASSLLARVTGAGSGHGGNAAGVAVGTTGKAAGMALSAKAVATGAAVVVAAAVGTGAVHHLEAPSAASGPASGSTPSRSHASTLPARHAPAVLGDASRLGVRSTLAHPPASSSRHGHHQSSRARATGAARTAAPVASVLLHGRGKAGGAMSSAPTQPRHTPGASGASDRAPALERNRSVNSEQHRSPVALSHRPSAPGSHRPPAAGSRRSPAATSHRPPAATSHHPPAATSHHPPAATSHHPPATESARAPAALGHRSSSSGPHRSTTNQIAAQSSGGSTAPTTETSHASAPVQPSDAPPAAQDSQSSGAGRSSAPGS